MKSGFLRGLPMNPFDGADYSAGEANHIYTAIEQDYKDLSLLLPKLLRILLAFQYFSIYTRSILVFVAI